MTKEISIKSATELGATAQSSIIESKAENTRISYQFAAMKFANFLGINFDELPNLVSITDTIVINFLDSLRGKDGNKAKPNTIKLRRAALVVLFDTLGFQHNPAKTKKVTLYIQGMQRRASAQLVKVKRARALSLYEVYRIVDSLGITERDLLYKALVLVGFSGLFRRSELLGMRVEDIKEHDQGYVVYLHSTKTSKGEGVYVNVPHVGEYSPAIALRNWLDVLKRRGVNAGFVFQTFHHNSVSGKPMTTQMFNMMLKLLSKTTGIVDWNSVSGHSLRRGGCTTMIKAGIHQNVIVEKGRWADSRMLNMYYEANVVIDDPMYKIFK